MFYRYISENLVNYINKGEADAGKEFIVLCTLQHSTFLLDSR